jgi:hypothetical protein
MSRFAPFMFDFLKNKPKAASVVGIFFNGGDDKRAHIVYKSTQIALWISFGCPFLITFYHPPCLPLKNIAKENPVPSDRVTT